MRKLFAKRLWFYGALLLLISLRVSAAELTLVSEAITPSAPLSSAQVFNGMGCQGKNLSPDLKWSGAPADTKTFAITVYDPDAPTGSGWWHWVVFNIPSTVTAVPMGAGSLKSNKLLPKGAIQSRTDFGTSGFGGACPPVGDKPHRYFFKVYALKDKIPLKAEAPAAMVGFYIQQLKLAEGVLEATYGR